MKKFKSKRLFASISIIILIIISVFTIYIYSKSNPKKNITDSSTSESTASSYYSYLYGTWVITKHVPSNIKTSLSHSMISFCIGQNFTVEEDKITSLFATIQNPRIEEGIMTSSDFTKKYNDTFSNLGIPDDQVKFIKITENGENGHSVTIFISTHDKVYALLGGALFELEKQ